MELKHCTTCLICEVLLFLSHFHYLSLSLTDWVLMIGSSVSNHNLSMTNEIMMFSYFLVCMVLAVK